MDIFINSFDGSPISFNEDDITIVDQILNWNKPSLVQVQYGYRAILICVSFPIPPGLYWAHKKSYRKLEKEMSPYLDKFESFLNSYGYILRRSPECPLKAYHYDFEFFVSKTDNGGLHFRDMEFAKDDLKLIKVVD